MSMFSKCGFSMVNLTCPRASHSTGKMSKASGHPFSSGNKTLSCEVSVCFIIIL